jgi:hypothetical protein
MRLAGRSAAASTTATLGAVASVALACIGVTFCCGRRRPASWWRRSRGGAGELGAVRADAMPRPNRLPRCAGDGLRHRFDRRGSAYGERPDLQVAAGTRLDWRDAHRIELRNGRLYVDSDGARLPIRGCYW